LDISELHIFTYSERPDTEAANMKQVPMSVRRNRSQKLHELSGIITERFAKQFTNSIRPVLFEKGTINKYTTGFTDNYLKVKVLYNKLLKNEIVDTKLLNYIPSENLFESDVIDNNILL